MKPESVVRKDDLLKSIFGDDDVGPSEGCNPVIHEDASDISRLPRRLKMKKMGALIRYLAIKVTGAKEHREVITKSGTK